MCYAQMPHRFRKKKATTETEKHLNLKIQGLISPPYVFLFNNIISTEPISVKCIDTQIETNLTVEEKRQS